MRITGVNGAGDGGALEVGPGSEARLFYCILDHNACAGAGGAAVVREDGLLFLDPCTVADNTGDYHLTWLAPGDSSRVNCVVDVWDDPLQLDPDGTPGDMGALPFDQYGLLLLPPPRRLEVTDLPDDEGGRVWLRFQASPNDGSPRNPVLGYSLWQRYPDAAPGDP